jgi:predicted O-methyltransferase YrrM
MTRRDTHRRIIPAALVAAGSVGFTAGWSIDQAQAGLALLVVACTCGLGLYLREMRRGLSNGAAGDTPRLVARLAAECKEVAASNHAAVLLAHRFPQVYMPVSSYSMNPCNIMVVLDLMEELRPLRVVELGCGISTLYAAAWLREYGGGRLISFDHDEAWACRCRRHLGRAGLDDLVDLYAVELGRRTASGTPWYELGAYDQDLRDIDLLIIDGPPAGEHPMARLPALAYFRDRLSANAAVFLDDGGREGERQIVKRWTAECPDLRVAFRYTLTGCYVLRTEGAAARA